MLPGCVVENLLSLAGICSWLFIFHVHFFRVGVGLFLVCKAFYFASSRNAISDWHSGVYENSDHSTEFFQGRQSSHKFYIFLQLQERILEVNDYSMLGRDMSCMIHIYNRNQDNAHSWSGNNLDHLDHRDCDGMWIV